eukprot:scaffold2191_cov254-Pinguiococcus_pyrenoidosus.AAC.30
MVWRQKTARPRGEERAQGLLSGRPSVVSAEESDDVSVPRQRLPEISMKVGNEMEKSVKCDLAEPRSEEK